MSRQLSTPADLLQLGRDRIKQLEKRVRKSPLAKRARKLQANFEKGPLGKRLARARRDADRATREGLANVFENLHIANAQDVSKLERRVETLTRKISKLENAKRRAA